MEQKQYFAREQYYLFDVGDTGNKNKKDEKTTISADNMATPCCKIA